MLERAGLAHNKTEPGKRKRPRRQLSPPADPDQTLWLPNSLVDGAARADPPIARLRRTQKVEWLQAFVELYGMHDLAGDGGIPRTLVRQEFERVHIADTGQFRIQGFKKFQRSCETTGPLARFKSSHMIDDDWPSWTFLNSLQSMRLLEVVDYLAESNSYESELLHPLTGDDLALELAEAISAAIESKSEWINYQRERQDLFYAIPVLRDYQSPAVFGVYRLTHRPHTKLTGAWYAKHCETCERFTHVYDAIAKGNFREAMSFDADIKAFQGSIKAGST